jgi:hypothetical protein
MVFSPWIFLFWQDHSKASLLGAGYRLHGDPLLNAHARKCFSVI